MSNKSCGWVLSDYRDTQEPRSTRSGATNITRWEGLGVKRDSQNLGE